MLVQTHKIISEHVYDNVQKILGISLNRNYLIYGSIKPDIALIPGKIPHFKKDSFEFICNEIYGLSNNHLTVNKRLIKSISIQIGIITHFIADFFCVPHNDRQNYEHHVINHIIYENRLHQLFKSFTGTVTIPNDQFYLGNYSSYPIKSFIDDLHQRYESRGESLMNDLKSSIQAASIVALFIVYHAFKNKMVLFVA